MKLIIGLGNPDTKYVNTRHNLGQTVILNAVKNLKLKLTNSTKLNAQVVRHGTTIFAITNEYMNNSGVSVQKIANFYKIEPQDIYLIHDDLDLPVGGWKLQFDRGPAGHNGVISTIEQLGTQAFWRYRVGIGHPRLDDDSSEDGPTNNIPVENYVLQPFTAEEKQKIKTVIDKITQEIINDLIHKS